MTTIAYRSGILASDTRAYSGDKQPMGHKAKIGRVELSSGEILTFGISTPHPGYSEQVRKWLGNERSRDHQPEPREFDMLLIDGAGQVFFFHDDFTPSGPLTGDYFSIGSGAEYALGAMAHGATAFEAVSAAAELDPWTAGPLQFIDTQNAGAAQ